MGAGSARNQRTKQLELQVQQIRDELRAYKLRDQLADVRLDKYGPMLISMFDEGRSHAVEATSNRHISVTSTPLYDIVVENDVDVPRILLKATNVVEGDTSLPATLAVYLTSKPGQDFMECDFEDMEDWFTHLLTGKRVESGRHNRRWREAASILPAFDYRSEN